MIKLTTKKTIPLHKKEADLKKTFILNEKNWLKSLLIEDESSDYIVHNFVEDQIAKQLNEMNVQVFIVEISLEKKEIAFFMKAIEKEMNRNEGKVYVFKDKHRFIVATFNNLVNTQRNRATSCKVNILKTAIEQYKKNDTKFSIGIGSHYKGLAEIKYSYNEALKAVSLKSIYKDPLIYYDDLGVYQLLLSLQESGLLQSYINKHLGALLLEDAKKNSDLLKTLKVYLDSNGCKKTAAEELHIVRQSIYYRLDKIKKLLGDNYMDKSNRLALQIAIQAYELEIIFKNNDN
jgi:sugar diacid utilization regulator